MVAAAAASTRAVPAPWQLWAEAFIGLDVCRLHPVASCDGNDGVIQRAESHGRPPRWLPSAWFRSPLRVPWSAGAGSHTLSSRQRGGPSDADRNGRRRRASAEAMRRRKAQQRAVAANVWLPRARGARRRRKAVKREMGGGEAAKARPRDGRPAVASICSHGGSEHRHCGGDAHGARGDDDTRAAPGAAAWR